MVCKIKNAFAERAYPKLGYDKISYGIFRVCSYKPHAFGNFETVQCKTT